MRYQFEVSWVYNLQAYFGAQGKQRYEGFTLESPCNLLGQADQTKLPHLPQHHRAAPVSSAQAPPGRGLLEHSGDLPFFEGDVKLPEAGSNGVRGYGRAGWLRLGFHRNCGNKDRKLEILYYHPASAPSLGLRSYKTSCFNLSLASLSRLIVWHCLYPSPMSSQASERHDASSAENERKEPLLLTDTPAEEQTADKTTLAVDGGNVQLDNLGPMVINSDGTISRISNWDKLTEPERQRTIRLVTQRNAIRVQKLKENTTEQPVQKDEELYHQEL
ncbi:hypothetical protein O181_083996 [Austropuccinia psidii MF-1]|uniref:Uncharacterized protein n=1 Tax=Austropuccinia psidii MF-1 TaxID=1389203 RepID=A0A9Q3FVN3_9BASI|nr:hypothetical protein [Austropuccinia psidii MF-1]